MYAILTDANEVQPISSTAKWDGMIDLVAPVRICIIAQALRAHSDYTVTVRVPLADYREPWTLTIDRFSRQAVVAVTPKFGAKLVNALQSGSLGLCQVVTVTEHSVELTFAQ